VTFDGGLTDGEPRGSTELTGSWVRTSRSECDASYPDAIEFDPRGIYLATAAAEATVHPLWDSGGYRVTADDLVEISTFTDEVVPYRFHLEDDRLSIETPDGCVLEFRRAG
jgi:hypothetical protein